MNRRQSWLTGLVLFSMATASAMAIVQQNDRTADSVQFRSEELVLKSTITKASEISSLAGDDRFAELNVAPANVFVDGQTGRFAAILMGQPLLPGRGLGNHLTWDGFGAEAPRSAKALEAAATVAFHGYLEAHAAALGLDLGELAGAGKVSALNDDYIQIYIPRVVGGVPVRNSDLVATIKYGNLILFGMENWGDLTRSAIPALTANDAAEALRRHVGADLFGRAWKASELVWIPFQNGSELDYRLSWIVRNDLSSAGARYEALVDAASGEVFEIQDATQWVATQRRAAGGVLPVSNDGVGTDGQEQPGWPMPFSSVTTPSGTVTADIGGNLPACVDGSITATLSGPYVTMADVCGAESLAGSGDIDWGTGPSAIATDCTTPGFGGAGNTKASRSGYNELNMLKAMARSQLPANPWLQDQLTANMNIANTCNANWNGLAVNFYNNGGSTQCANTGEIAAVFDHEWGHGLDNNDNVPTIAAPGEAIADTYAAFRLNTSCIGRGFRIPVSNACTGYGSACIGAPACTGVREIDYAKHAGLTASPLVGVPALIAGPGSIGGAANGANTCPATGSRGPCNKEVHCEGVAPGEAVWDVWNRKLVAPPYSYPLDKAREVAAQFAFRGAGNQTAWYSCNTVGLGGCAAGNGYRTMVAADDDDGNLANGTPHWTAINDAFDDHLVGCTTDTPVDFGCSGAPSGVTTVTATPRDKAVLVSWTAIAAAQGYRVYRTDGVHGCDFGKILVATVSGSTLSYVDSGLQNGRQYSYQVIPMGAQDECFGDVSSCTSATPVSGVATTFLSSQAVSTAVGGDSDPFLDNCETLHIVLPITNSGSTTLTNLRVVAASSPSHPSSTVLSTLPAPVAASLAPCSNGTVTLDMKALGLAQGDQMTVHLELTSDEFSPNVLTFDGPATIATEGSLQTQASKTWSFLPGADGWNVVAGTFNLTNAAPVSPDGNQHWQSSQNLDNQCDAVSSPVVRLSATSTMTLSTSYRIEPLSDAWYDRANIGLVNAGTGVRTVLTPDSGRGYQASGVNGTCGLANQVGWAGVNDTWAASTWSAAALGSQANVVGKLEIRYGTDPGGNDTGFRFDGVTITDFDLAVPDTQSNSCLSPTIFVDGFNAGNANLWTVVP
ncbi:MAG: hypothetical protein ABI639_14665 [Thermoanaerobaculia bacterium]